MKALQHLIVLCAVITTSLIRQTNAAPDWFVQLFQCSHGTVCTINFSPGGVPYYFELAAISARTHNTQVRINGKCASACVIFAIRAKQNVCLTENAQMGLHYGRRTAVYEPFGKEVDVTTSTGAALYRNPPPGYRVERTYFLPDYGEITQWALDENKVPYVGMYWLTRDEALRFWKPCR